MDGKIIAIIDFSFEDNFSSNLQFTCIKMYVSICW